jgi:hypothetical protein
MNARTSGKWWGAILHVTASNSPSVKGRLVASATRNSTFAMPRLLRNAAAASSIGGVRSVAITRAT